MLEPLEARILLSAVEPGSALLDAHVDADRLVPGEVIRIPAHSEAAIVESEDPGIFGDIEGTAPLAAEGVAAAGDGSVEASATTEALVETSPLDEGRFVAHESAVAIPEVNSTDSHSWRMVETLTAGQGPPGSDPVVANETTEAIITWLGGTGE